MEIENNDSVVENSDNNSAFSKNLAVANGSGIPCDDNDEEYVDSDTEVVISGINEPAYLSKRQNLFVPSN